MKGIGAIIITALFITACSDTKELANHTNSVQNIETQEGENSQKTQQMTTNSGNPENIEETINIEEGLFAYIRRGACFGQCPVFEFTIYADGRATYKGISNVEMIGDYEATFEASTLDGIKRMAASIKYYEFKDRYDNEHITDIPSTTTRLQIDGQYKEVIARYEIPPALLRFQDYLDQLVGKTEWKKK